MISRIVLLGVIINLFITFYILMRPASENQKWLLLTSAIASTANILYMFELQVSEIAIQCSIDNLIYMLKGFAVVSFFKFVFNYCDRKLSPWVSHALMAYAIVAATLSGTNNLTHWLNTPIDTVKTEWGSFLYLDYHWLYYFVLSVYLGIAVYSVWLLVVKSVKASGIERRKTIFLVAAVLSPISGVFIRFANLNSRLDSLMINFTIGMVLIAIMVHRYGLSDATKVAMEDITANSQNGLIVIDNNYNIIYVNPSVLKSSPDILNYAKEHPEEIKQLFGQREQIVSRGNRDYEIRISDLYERRAKIGQMAWIYDMTYISQYTQEIIKLKREADAANAAKSQFLADMSHEIRTPMNAIIGFSSLMMEEENAQKNKQYAKDINESANILLSLINKILDISRIEAGKMEVRENTYNVKSLLSSVNNVIGYVAKNKGLHYHESIGDEVPAFLYGAGDTIYEILVNLLNNGVKYTPRGYVSLQVNYRKADEKLGYLDFIISDSGQGMSEEDLQHVFEKFSRVDSEENKHIEGTGLGMAIVKGMLELMKGSIRLESKIGEGTTVYVTVPQRMANESGIEQTMEKRVEDDRSFEIPEAKILVVDDNELNLRVISSIFNKYNNKIDTADSGEMALRILQDKQYDIIFMDQMMPVMDGIHAMEEIRKMPNQREACIVLLTANAIQGVREKMLAKGFDGYLTKPIIREDLSNLLLDKIPPEKIVIGGGGSAIDSFAGGAAEPLKENVIGVLNVGEGIEACGGSEEDYKDILSFMCEAFEERSATIQLLYETEDWENYTINVHGLKSSTRSVGAFELSDAAKALEAAGKEMNLDYIHAHHRELMELYSRTVANGLEYIGGDIGQVKEIHEEIDQADVLLIIHNISNLIEEFQLNDAANVANELLGFEIDEALRVKVEELKKYLDAFDYEGSKKLVDEIK